MIPRISLLCIISYYCNTITGKSVDTISKTYADKFVEPVGCNETTMWATTRKSKMECAVSCLSTNTCVVFTYSDDSDVCSFCFGGMIQSLTYNTTTLYSWAYQIITLDSIFSAGRYIPLTNGLHLGTVIHLSVVTSQNTGTQPFLYIDLKDAYNGRNSLISCQFSEGKVTVNSVGPVRGDFIHVDLAPGTIQKNREIQVDFLVTNLGYYIYLDKSFCCLYKHSMPYGSAKYIWMRAHAQVTKVTV
nr:hypothetical protein BgiMline_028594 [Biomphalaria glabrata]